jgi:ABC superfamily ATP binding cassette transporter, ABC protein
LVGLSGEKESIENALSYIKGQGVSVDVLEEAKGGA